MIIDAHLHLPVISEYRTYEQSKALLIEDLKKDQVDYAILIPDNLPNSSIGDVPTCLELVKDAPELFLMGTIDIETQGQEWLVELERLLSERRIVGMKIFPGHDPIYPTDYAMCNRRDHLEMVKQLPVTAEIRDGILWGNAMELFRLPIPGG
jgi:predicted TIM-barrel fold metal-dependent hydrolase